MIFRHFNDEPQNLSPTSEKVGVLLVNLGTPESLRYWPMRRYLKQFLSDYRVIEANPVIWKPILNALLAFIPFKSRKGYAPIWDSVRNKSPLFTITEAQANKLSIELSSQYGESIETAFAFRYGQPSIESRLTQLKQKGCTRILVFPLYPQYAGATTGSVMDDVFNACKKMRWVPSLRMVDPYYAEEVYVNVVAKSISEQCKKEKTKPDAYVFSYHGLPQSYATKGDPYPTHCDETTKRVSDILALSPNNVYHCYQSKFGKAEWLAPATDQTIKNLAQQGIKNICVVTPGFAADCVETLGEINLEAREDFVKNGGTTFTFVPCLNDSDLGIHLLNTLVKKHLTGWLDRIMTFPQQDFLRKSGS